ncbi:MAG: hypothetical protein COC01_02285 [Bacteroidetes bacterium]|nr:hypothetical protein [Bacteroidia bacterium]PCH69136.1 MAG: hypothetical protein COC01_02285 [Bacteroidota bacterium]
MKSLFAKILLSCSSLIIVFIIAELLFRAAIFNEVNLFSSLKKAGLYAKIYPDKYQKIFSEEYWKLNYLFGAKHQPPNNPHPLLGWTGFFDRNTYLHKSTKWLRGRRSVLLYGDSFSQCVSSVECFEDILNKDTVFSKEHCLFNYGVGGYGVGQIYLLLKNSYIKYDNPYVIVGIMARDLERSIISVRSYQKPYFTIENESLMLQGVPINNSVDDYYENNGPGISSYLYRYFLNSNLNFLPKKTEDLDERIETIKKVNEKIILQIIKDLRGNEINFLFLIFHPLPNSEFDWRNGFLRELLEKNSVPYIWALDLIKNDTTFDKYKYENYEIPNNGHPTTHQNQLISNEIKRCILDSSYVITSRERNTRNYLKEKVKYDDSKIEYYEYKIRHNKKWMTKIINKAEEEGTNVDTAIKREASFVLKKRLEKK